MNQNYYDPNLCYNSNSFGLDQYQPPQYSVTHQPPQEKSIAELLLKAKLPQALQALYEKLNKYVQEKQEEKNIAEEQAATVSSQNWKPPIYYDDDDDDDEEYSIQVSEFFKKYPIAITPVLPTIEPEDSLSMGDEHLSIIPKKESDKVIKTSVENLVSIPIESKDLTDYESECDMPVCDDSSSKNEAIIESMFLSLHDRLLSPSSSNSLMKEINIFLAPDDSIPPGIENERPILRGHGLFLKELLNDDSIFPPDIELFHVDFYNVPSSPRPPGKTSR
ncbi:hypothetical protein Tco_0123436 [Tanacetum coccineum]